MSLISGHQFRKKSGLKNRAYYIRNSSIYMHAYIALLSCLSILIHGVLSIRIIFIRLHVLNQSPLDFGISYNSSLVF